MSTGELQPPKSPNCDLQNWILTFSVRKPKVWVIQWHRTVWNAAYLPAKTSSSKIASKTSISLRFLRICAVETAMELEPQLLAQRTRLTIDRLAVDNQAVSPLISSRLTSLVAQKSGSGPVGLSNSLPKRCKKKHQPIDGITEWIRLRTDKAVRMWK